MYDWDEDKRQANLAKHGVDFVAMESFQWDTAVEDFDDRHDEPRWLAAGIIEDQLHVVAYTVSEDVDIVRIISLRRATPQERRRYAEARIRINLPVDEGGSQDPGGYRGRSRHL